MVHDEYEVRVNYEIINVLALRLHYPYRSRICEDICIVAILVNNRKLPGARELIVGRAEPPKYAF